MMAELKTKPSEQSVEQFLNDLPDEQKRADSKVIADLMRQATQAEPRVWGDKIIGFGDYHYKYASGREGDWFRVGFAPRKQNITLYLGYDVKAFGNLISQLGKCKTGGGCLYINKLADVDQAVLKTLIEHVLVKLP
jgi:hypothetical protein